MDFMDSVRAGILKVFIRRESRCSDVTVICMHIALSFLDDALECDIRARRNAMSRHALRDFISDLSVLDVVPKDVVRTEVSDMLFSGRSFCVDVVVTVGQRVLIFAVAYNYDSASASS